MCSEILQSTDGVMPVSEIVSPLMQEENLALLDVSHLDDVEHYPIAYTVANRVRESAYSQWLIEITQKASMRSWRFVATQMTNMFIRL